jgi:glutathione S-transferase
MFLPKNFVMARYLYSTIFCPLSRKIAFGLREKKIAAKEIFENIYAVSDKLWNLNPAGDLPVFIDASIVCANDYVACEYLEEVYPAPILMGDSPQSRAEIRRLLSWWDHQFYQDTYLTLFYEKALKQKFQKESPDTAIIKDGKKALNYHLCYFNRLAEARNFLSGGDTLSWADISGACHLSCIDYLGDIRWEKYPFLKSWYMRIKSRPTFRPFLKQSLPNVKPSNHYAELDF